MKCPRCHSDVLDDSRFCSKCGEPIHAAEKDLAPEYPDPASNIK